MADENDKPDEEEAPPPAAVPPEQEERIVDKVVSKVRSVFEEIVGPGSGADGGDESPTSSAPPGPAATEADMERKVREATRKEITASERRTAAQRERQEISDRLDALEGKVTETPPKVYSKLTTALWGGDDS